MKYFEVQLKKSGISRQEIQKRTLLGLGLNRFGKKVYLKDTPAIRGMLYKVVHLVDVTPRSGDMPPSARERRRAQREA